MPPQSELFGDYALNRLVAHWCTQPFDILLHCAWVTIYEV